VISYLDPGDNAPFRILLDSSQTATADQLSYEFFTDVEITDLKPGFDLAFSENHTDYVDTFDTFHLVGELTNNSDTLLSVYLIAGIYDAEGAVLDASSLSLPVISIAEGETILVFDIWGAMSYIPAAYDSESDYSVQVDWGWTYETEYAMVDLTTEGNENTYDDFQGIFTGKVVNQSGVEVDSAQVIIALYDKADGRLVATDYTYISGPIENGASVEYNVYVSISEGFDPNSVEFVITAKGQKP
jgi:hypothetical protein